MTLSIPSTFERRPALSAVHYENDVAFFASFLDPYMKYGSGLFAEGDDFEAASVRMLDRAIDQAGLAPGARARACSTWGRAGARCTGA